MSLDFNHLEECFGFALDNIAKNGDTDIFLFPYETRMFEDEREKLIKSLMDTYINFSDRVEESSPINISTFSTVGYLGYRWVTQIDPYWNVFFLGLILNLSSKIEQQRKNTDCVYSYRIQPDEELKSIFNKEIGWRNYQEKSIEYCNSNENVNYILSCDIADFYTRVYHHPLENALQRIDEPSYDKAKKIMSLLQKFSKMTSYGLPVGGAASRILAELALNKIDNLLAIRGIKFKRFVDDYYIFCNSSGEARLKLGELSTLLMQNLGLTIQKHKTNIYSKEEFIAITEAKLYGSMILIVMGMYQTIYFEAINKMNIPLLIPSVLGGIVGLLLGAQLIRFLLGKFHQVTYMGIMGLLVGSAYQLFYSNKISEINIGFAISMLVMLVMAALIYWFSINEIKEDKLK